MADKKYTKLEKLAITLMLIGAAMTVIASIIIALNFNILIGIAVSGIFLLTIGLIMANISSNRKE